MPVMAIQGYGKLRLDGFYNYGPWPFYVGAAFDWLFGTSYELQRYLHPLALFVTFVIAFMAFRRLNVGVAALYAWVVLALLWSTMWPMVRPDPFTALFAMAAIASATAALVTSRRRYWFLTAFCAASAVTTHLVAIAIVPWALILLAIDFRKTWSDKPNDPFFKRYVVQRLVMAGLGVVLAVAIFLEAIDFRLGDFFELATLVSVKRGTGLMGLWESLSYHFTLMWIYAPRGIAWVVAAGVACGFVAVALLPFYERRHARVVLAYFLPPMLFFVLFLASLSAYSFYHSGYTMIGQLASTWAAAAGVGLLAWLVAERVSYFGPVVTLGTPVLAGIVVLAQANLTSTQGTNWSGAPFIKFARYYDEVLSNVPRRALILGSSVFGLESGSRHALLNWSDAATRLKDLPDEQRAKIAPDFFLMNEYLRFLVTHSIAGQGRPEFFNMGSQLEIFPGATYRQKKIVHAMPYGTTIVYERTTQPAPAASPPRVSLFNHTTDSWASELVAMPLPQVSETAPATFDLPAMRTSGAARRTKAMTLPPGGYLLELQPGTPGSGIFIGTGTSTYTSLLGVNQNFELFEAPFAPPDGSVHMLVRHPGGPLYISLAGRDHEGADFSIKAMWRIVDYQVEERSMATVPIDTWKAQPGVTLATEPDGWLVASADDASLGPYIRTGPIAVPRNATLRVRIDLREFAGDFSIGVYGRNNHSWLHAPRWHGVSEVTFNTGDNDQIDLSVARVHAKPGTPGKFAMANPRLTEIESALERVYRFYGCIPSGTPARPFKPGCKAMGQAD